MAQSCITQLIHKRHWHASDCRVQLRVCTVLTLVRPAAIVRDLQLKRPIYQQTAAYGHFGRELADFEWEKLSRLSEFSAALGR